ncbi:phage tail assembly chaperone [Pseudomonas sp. C2B4]|uniref:phage tail assembly chaperone n=1 Tax=Pseudomonas sp. C2B4 TaxID=2735270 RepID=UPI0015861BC7|nr:phage tail assembly chaperone [Pseudomonas sp. C2B4]NUU37378.1 phage tail protein [Pseudomonas sp. C2B4]
MTVFFCPTTAFFYDDEICSFIPEGVIEYSAEERDALLALVSHGRRVVAGADGYPVLIDPPPLAPEEAAAIERVWRDAKLAATDGVVTRHRDELEGGATTTLTPEQYSALQQYRQALRNWPESGEFPLIDHRPLAPPWLAENL